MTVNVPISIDFTPLIQEFSLTKQEVSDMMQYTLEQCASHYAHNWAMLAKRDLKSTAQMYIQSLQVVKHSPNSVSVMLNGDLANNIEEGLAPYDMKTVFARSSKVKNGKKGWYLVIPFRHAVPSAQGFDNVFSNVMPNAVYKAMRNSPTGRLTTIPPPYNAVRVRARFSSLDGQTTFSAYVHKTSIYQGMIRRSEAGSTSYNTFRTASAVSDPMSWIHKGIEASHFSKKAMDLTQFDKIIDVSIDDFLNSR